MKNGVVSCKWNVHVKLDAAGRGRTQYTRALTCCMLQPPGTLLLLCSQLNLGSEGLTYKEEGFKSAHRGQLAATRPNLPGFDFNFIQQHKTESWLTTGANAAGEEQVPNFSIGSGTHGSTGTVKKGGTRYWVPMTGKHGLRAMIILVFIYTQGKSSTSGTGPRKRHSFPGLRWATVVNMLSFQKIPLFYFIILVWNSTF